MARRLQARIEARTLLPKSKSILIAIEVVALIIILVAGLWIRVYPFIFVSNTLDQLPRIYPRTRDLPNDILQYSYLFGNDPWFEYWLAKYLFDHGILSWNTLTRNNPATHIFWYPWGRDLRDYPLIPFITAYTYRYVHGIFSLQQWIALLPPIAASLMILLGYLYIRRLYGVWAALTAAALLAVLPASFDRTHAGFVEKEGVAMPLVILGFYLTSIALGSRTGKHWAIPAIIAGLSLGLVGATWGGYLMLALVLAASALLAPLGPEPDTSRTIIKRIMAVSIAYAITIIVLNYTIVPKINARAASIVSIGGVILAYIIHWLVITAKKQLGEKLPILRSERKVYTMILIVVAGLVLAYLPYMGVRGRAYYIIMWPLRASIKFHPLIESVAEHQPIIGSPSFYEINIILFTGILGALLILFNNYIRKGRAEELPLGVISLGALYGVLGMAYLLQTAGVMGALSTAALFGLIPGRGEEKKRRKRARRTTRDLEDIRIVAVALLTILAISIIAYNAHIALATMNRVPSILTANTNTVNPAWLITLKLLRQTPNDTVVVTWWDYGYWVSVGAHRATLADGATENATQIEVLAKMLISNENLSARIMRGFGLKPGKTLVLVHDIVDVSTNGDAVLVGAIDIPKSYWMVRIAGFHDSRYKVENYFVPVDLGQGRRTIMISAVTQNASIALIYNILADAALKLSWTNVTITNAPINATRIYLSPVDFMRVSVEPKLTRFRPYKIVAYKLGSYRLSTGETMNRYIVIAIYEWVS
ncbi:MAG: STT3 domain-containing protein [Pyrodictiaceae archaeon]